MAVAAKKSSKKAKKGKKLQPLGERIVVEREESLEQTAGGIFLPGGAPVSYTHLTLPTTPYV